MFIFKRENYLTNILLFFYFSLCYLLLISYFGLFNYFFLVIYLLTVLLFLYFLLKNYRLELFEWILIILIPIILIGFALFKGFICGDAYVIWFPWAQQIADFSQMPKFLENSGFIFAASNFPFFSLLLAIIFKFFPHQENLTFIVPFIFNILTFLLIFRWFKDKGINKTYIIFGLLLLISNPLLAKYGWDLFQESLIIFFFTVFFYYLDSYSQDKTKKNLILLFIAANLAMMSKISGFFLGIPLLIIFFKDGWFKEKKIYYLLLFFLPVISWLARNYIFYGNPFFPVAENLFSGPYHKVVELYVKYFSFQYQENLSISIWLKKLMTFFPIALAAFYGLIKRKNWLVFLPIIIMLGLEASLSVAIPGAMRHNYAILGTLVFYGVFAIWQEKSKIISSILFLASFYVLVSVPLVYSQSQFFAPLEQKFYFISRFAELIISYHWFVIVALSGWFYYFIARKNFEISKYLLFTVIALNFLNFSSIQISWLNIWIFILGFILIIVIIPFFLATKTFIGQESIIRIFLIIFLLIMLFANSLGLASSYFIAHKKFIFPKPEALGSIVDIGNFLKEREGNNKNFYVLGDFPATLGWRFGYHEASIDNYTFHYLTNSEYREEMTPQELHDFLKKYNFKYINKTADYPAIKSLYQKIESNEGLFPLIFKEKNAYLWLVK